MPQEIRAFDAEQQPAKPDLEDVWGLDFGFRLRV